MDDYSLHHIFGRDRGDGIVLLDGSLLLLLEVNQLLQLRHQEYTAVNSAELFITQGSIFLGLTVIGVITAIGRLFDAVTDPYIASKSDRCRHKDGRRIPFMRAIAVPFAAVTVLIFVSPVSEVSWVNNGMLLVTLLIEGVSRRRLDPKYEGYIKRQLIIIEQVRRLETKHLPDDIDYSSIDGLSLEAREKLGKVRPDNIGQASRISGVSPADISVLVIYLSALKNKAREENE